MPCAHPHLGGFCTWTERRESAHRGHVVLAAHGFSHRPLDDAGAELHSGIPVYRPVLEAHLSPPVTRFVFPSDR